MKKTIILLMLMSGLAFSQDLKKSMNFQVNSNDLEILKLIVSDYNQRLIQTNITYKIITNNVVVTNVSTMILPEIKDGKTNYIEQPIKMLSTNLETQTITNIAVITNGVWYDTAEQFYDDRILSLVNKYHTELIKTTIRDYLRNKIKQSTNDNDKSALIEQLKNYE